MDDPETRFTQLYDTHYRRVMAYALTHAEPHTAEDIVSETFLIAWRRFGDVGDPALPWLLGVARNLLHKQRAGGRRGRDLAERIKVLSGPADLAAWDVADHVVERDAALAAIAALPERDLETLALVTWHGLEPRQAAKVVGCSAAAFFVRLHRARKRLARALEAGPAPRPATPAVVREAAR
ncbi:RNA polymerase sigma factor [Actinomadura hibisca]|uniref:RNA polymerase sigma factor n=1 Tax=Actinomadura hibisca TaxID=68565 RepID=UPI000A63A714|nr:sigma-70 family RNA polymerase sigma factor [Actinomadura hibisca]